MPVYLKIGKIQGVSKAKGHEGWIELLSASFVTSNTTVNGREKRETSKDIQCAKNSDATSPLLMNLGASGSVVQATIDFVDNDGKTYLQLVLEDVVVTSYRVGSNNSQPLEQFSLNVRKMSFRPLATDAPADLFTLSQDPLFLPGPL